MDNESTRGWHLETSMKIPVRKIQDVDSATIRRWIGQLMAVTLVSSVIIYFATMERLPDKIKIHSGMSTGLYHKVVQEIKNSVTERTGVPVVNVESNGSLANLEALEKKDADFAIVQGTVDFSRYSIVTPLYPDVILVIARKGSGIKNIRDFRGQSVSIGPVGSGMRQSAHKLLEHYGVEVDELKDNELYFDELLTNEQLVGAIVTTGIQNADLKRIFDTEKFDLVPIEDANAIELKNPFLKRMDIPQGLFGIQGDVPKEPVTALTSTAFIVTRDDMQDRLVQAVVKSVHEDNLRLKFPSIFRREQVPEWASSSLHPAALTYFYPTDNIGLVTQIIDSLNALKELILAAVALCYLFWTYWRKLMAREAEAKLEKQRAILDRFMEATFSVEKAQSGSYEVSVLRESLFRITTIRLRALKQFTGHEIRSDQRFSIFMTQCGDLINKIQLKMVSQLASGVELPSIEREYVVPPVTKPAKGKDAEKKVFDNPDDETQSSTRKSPKRKSKKNLQSKEVPKKK